MLSKVLHRGFPFVIAGPSGTGKTTLCRELLSCTNNIFYSVSFTTRKPRKGEREGTDYYFISKKEFERKIQNHEFIEWAEVYGKYYGTLKLPVIENIEKGKIVLMDLDHFGMKQIKEKIPESVAVYILPPSLKELKRRILLKRGDSKQEAEIRLKSVIREIDYWIDYDYVLINKKVKESVEIVKSIITAELFKRERFTLKIEDRIK